VNSAGSIFNAKYQFVGSF